MRNNFISKLTLEADKRDNIIFMVGDLGYGAIEPFVEKHPDKFLNAGIAEQNMAGVAAGLASEGYHVFIYSIGNFPTFRCAEQIRNDIDYHKFPVTIVSIGGGVAYGALGYSHHTIQDYALMRSFPNMIILSPGDPLEVLSCLNFILDNPSPSYLRLGKTGEKKIHKKPPVCSLGKPLKIKNICSKKLVLTTGAILGFLDLEQIHADIYSLPIWSQTSSFKNLNELFDKYEEIEVMEDHLMDGGFGSWVLERVNKNSINKKIKLSGFNNKIIGEVGSQKFLHKIALKL